MTTLIACLVSACGLSQAEAADYLDARLDTVKSWTSGRRNAPQGAIDELGALYRAIEARAAAIMAGTASASTISLPAWSNDVRKTQGVPCAGAWGVVIAIVAARSDKPVSVY